MEYEHNNKYFLMLEKWFNIKITNMDKKQITNKTITTNHWHVGHNMAVENGCSTTSLKKKFTIWIPDFTRKELTHKNSPAPQA